MLPEAHPILQAPIASGANASSLQTYGISESPRREAAARALFGKAQLAGPGNVTRARLTQNMDLRLLASDTQGNRHTSLRVFEGRAPLYRHLVHVVRKVDWKAQRNLWRKFLENELKHSQRTD